MSVRRIAVETEEDWLRARRTGVGSSDAPMILGVSPYGGAVEVFADKIGQTPARPPSEAMRIGRLLEPVIALLYAEKYPDRKVGNPEGGLFRSRQYPPLLATPDRWCYDPERGAGLLEIKTVGEWRQGEWDDEPPLAVLIQVAAQMAVLGAAWAAVAALIGGTRLVTYDVERNDSFINETWIPRALAFWGYVERREIPPAEKVSLEVLKQLYPTVAPRTIELPRAALSWHEQYTEAGSEVRRWEAVRDDAKARILGAMGDAEVAHVPETLVRYTRTVVNVKEKVIPASSYVRLGVKTNGGAR
jgi:putative phage-type endonuclease